MFRRFAIAFASLAFIAMPAQAEPTPRPHHHQESTALQQYTNETSAQSHCPSDTVVWLNTHTGIWHLNGERWYGRTRYGAYVCEQEAAAAGDRETRNGQ
jgi:hypothetical protein